MSARVLSAGLQATVQDGARHGFRHLGVGSAGAMDAYSHVVANLLVGNAPKAPVIEAALVGPALRFERPVRVALCGATADATVDGQAIPGWRPVDLPGGAELRVGRLRAGARLYLAVAGGWSVPRILGSSSTDLRGGFGGMRGRALAVDDVLPIGRGVRPATGLRIAPWWIDPAPDLDFSTPACVHLLPGRDALAPGAALHETAWRVAPASNRQGLRLEGPRLQLDAGTPAGPARVSEPVAPGTVQLPEGGEPIVLLADAQSHGGYPRVGHAIACDRPRLAQLRPGDTVRFVPCTPAEATRLRRAQAARLARITMAVAGRAWGD